jgi:hypothetical protein
MMRRSGAGPDRRARLRHPFPCDSFDRFGKALQRRQRAAYAVVGLAADARIQQHLQARLPGQLDNVHVTPPR